MEWKLVNYETDDVEEYSEESQKYQAERNKNMTLDKFSEQVEEFIKLHCQEYMRSAEVTYCEPDEDDEDGYHTAIVHLEADNGSGYDIPIHVRRSVRGYRIGSNLVISRDPDIYQLNANTAGLFAFLWNEESTRYRKAKCLIEDIDRIFNNVKIKRFLAEEKDRG